MQQLLGRFARAIAERAAAILFTHDGSGSEVGEIDSAAFERVAAEVMQSASASASASPTLGAAASLTPATVPRIVRFAPWVEQELALAGGARAAAAHATAVGAAAALQTSLWHAERATFAAMHVQLSRSYFRADLSAEQVLSWHVRPLVRPLLRFDLNGESGAGGATSATGARGVKGDGSAAAASAFVDAPFSAAFEVRVLLVVLYLSFVLSLSCLSP